MIERVVTSGLFTLDGADVEVENNVWIVGDDRQVVEVGGTSLSVLATPGHSPGGVCLHDNAGNVMFTGDTLFRGGPGATGHSFSDYGTIVDSIRDRLLVLPLTTRVLTGHGDETTIGDEAPRLPEWEAAR